MVIFVGRAARFTTNTITIDNMASPYAMTGTVGPENMIRITVMGVRIQPCSIRLRPVHNIRSFSLALHQAINLVNTEVLETLPV